MRWVSTEAVHRRVSEVLRIEVTEATSVDTVFEAVHAPVHHVPDYESYDDDVVLGDRVQLFLWPPGDSLLIETWFQPPKGGSAFEVSAGDFKNVVAGYRQTCGQLFFSGGDIIVVSTTSSNLWAFHHEGAWIRSPDPRADGV